MTDADAQRLAAIQARHAEYTALQAAAPVYDPADEHSTAWHLRALSRWHRQMERLEPCHEDVGALLELIAVLTEGMQRLQQDGQP